MRKALILLILLMIICGCTKYAPYYDPPVCYVPERPQLEALDETEHIASPKNIGRLVLIVIDQDAHIKRLDSAIECYRGTDHVQN